MAGKRLLVVGAGGDVGQGIVGAALETGHKVVAAGRSRGRLERLEAAHKAAGLALVAGDIGDERSAEALWTLAARPFGGIDAVVVSVNAPIRLGPFFDWSAAELEELFRANVLTHFIAAKIFIPRLPAEGLFIAIGGGTADFILPKMAPLSVMQAGMRMMYRGVVRERRDQPGPAVRELMIVSMVNGESKRGRADPSWVTDVEVGRHVCAILAAPQLFPGPILELKSRAQAGQPDIAKA